MKGVRAIGVLRGRLVGWGGSSRRWLWGRGGPVDVGDLLEKGEFFEFSSISFLGHV